MVGATTRLFCADISDTLVYYSWLKWNNSVKIFNQTDLLNAKLYTMLPPRLLKQADGNKRGVYLNLANLTKADEGLYTCLAVNIYGRYAYKSAFLTVKQPMKSKFMLPLKFRAFFNEF